MADPAQVIILKIFAVLVGSITTVLIFKPLIVIAAEQATCSSCDATVSILLTAIMFFGAVGIVMYQIMKGFWGSE